MLILHDYLPSQNAWKVRQLLALLEIEYEQRPVSIFEGEGQTPGFLAKNPVGAVPVLELEDGRCLPESNAILWYLADGSDYLPTDAWQRAQVQRWLYFEEDVVQNGVAAYRHWSLTGKLARRSAEAIAGKAAASQKALGILDHALESDAFLVDSRYTIADISLVAYIGFLEGTDLSLEGFPNVMRWIETIRHQPGFLAETHPYSSDPHSANELP
ncbi:MAG: glutathione S-transferase family protein [Gammaproteobacteria bacterium]|nr:glutathione S-transferase family protein [Gammaproteobacteria bacterium]